MPNYHYVIRLQDHESYEELFAQAFPADRCSRLIYVKHYGKNGDNPHWHLCLTDSKYDKRESLRAFLKREYFTKAKGNGHMSIKYWDGHPNACAYLFHENTPVTNVRGFTDKEYEMFHQKNEQIQQEKVKVPEIIEKAVERLRNYKVYGHDNNTTQFYKYYEHETLHKRIFKVLLDECRRSKGWIPNKFQMERYINKVQLMLATDPKEYHELEYDLYNQYFPHL